MNAEEVALRITREAASEVNRRWNESGGQGSLATDPVRVLGYPFKFEIPVEQAALLTEEQKQTIAGWCREAIAQRLDGSEQNLGGLIVGYAKQGHDFFDEFN
jgi:hypothetical protein